MKEYIFCDITSALNYTNDIRKKQVKKLDNKVRMLAFGTLLCVGGLLGYIYEQASQIKRLNRIIDDNDETVEELQRRVSKLENKDLD